MYTLILLLISSPGFAQVTDNCHGKSFSSFNQFALTRMDDRHNPLPYLESDCFNEGRLAILDAITGSDGLTGTDDYGVIEYISPESQQRITCRYRVKKGTSVPRAILQYENLAPRPADLSYTELELAKLYRMGAEIVDLDCSDPIS